MSTVPGGPICFRPYTCEDCGGLAGIGPHRCGGWEIVAAVEAE